MFGQRKKQSFRGNNHVLGQGYSESHDNNGNDDRTDNVISKRMASLNLIKNVSIEVLLDTFNQTIPKRNRERISYIGRGRKLDRRGEPRLPTTVISFNPSRHG